MNGEENMKLQYQKIEAEWIELSKNDLILTSGGGYEPPEEENDGDVELPKVPLK